MSLTCSDQQRNDRSQPTEPPSLAVHMGEDATKEGQGWVVGWVLGAPHQKTSIQKQKTYLDEMKIVGEKLHYILKNNSKCIFVLGDVHKPSGSRNTALEISEIYSTLGYKTLKIIDDEIPLSTRTANKWKGKKDMLNTKQKLDRILIMKVEK